MSRDGHVERSKTDGLLYKNTANIDWNAPYLVRVTKRVFFYLFSTFLPGTKCYKKVKNRGLVNTKTLSH